MIYPAGFEVKSGFAAIRQTLHEYCLIEYSHELVDTIHFSNDYHEVLEMLNQTEQLKYILQFVSGFPQQDYYDLSSEIRRIKTKGTYLDSETLTPLRLSLETITSIITFIEELDDNYPDLKNILPASKPDRSIIDRILKIVDEKGDIKDNASERLNTIRKEIKSRVSSIDRRIGQILVQARKDSIISDDAEIAIRNGRLVIPVPAGNKRRLKGYVHDTSATGQTVFIEPAEVFETNNDIQNLRVEEKQEIINILTDFTDNIRFQADELITFYVFLGEIDFIRCKAKLAIDYNAVKPVISENPLIQWRNAIHPILQKTLARQGKQIVSQEIELNTDKRIMVISGPNAGGKSVTLKTVALLQYMLQCGLLIPVNEDSCSGIFAKIFLEIGDEQSLENDLSTYSSHLIHIKYFLENVNDKTLFLIDEFGAGTEPQLGGAMAEASLEKLNQTGCFGIVTTHYTNLKLMADNSKGIFNAAMLYDTRAMSPFFKLSTGKPGSSFAFEIANKIGFPKDVIGNAEAKVGPGQLDFERQLAQLEVDKKFIVSKTAELKAADETLAELVDRYTKLVNDLETKKSLVIKDARQRAQQLVDQSNKLIERTIREIKENKAEKEVTRQLRDEFAQASQELLNRVESDDNISIPDEIPVVEKKEPIPSYHLRKGAYVKMDGQESIGVVSELKGNRVLVTFGSFNIRTTIDKLILASPSEIKLYEQRNQLTGKGFSVAGELNTKMAEFRMSIDLRGKRPEEAKAELIKYIDQALLLRVSEVRILHGKGNGVLRNLVHEYLNDNPEVLRIEDESIERGGHGITVAYLQ